MAAPSSRAGATRRAATVLLASLLLAVASGGGGVGEPADRDGVGGPMDCFTTCSTQLVGYIMTTIQCFNKCAAGGGGGAAAVAEASVCAARGDDRLALEWLLREAACGCDRGEPRK
ncbi:uncharacterized protein C2845_PM15G06730 [Panicum miliaceum]|uniref:Uncharacterized protein n=1 Tax=Panicum miliaceum TaxID=4540 RepID=A0A3L6QA17_PANMI|nr:uncharacterized protein C2845_PM15G06730 [Panicum miliaceum]